MGVAPAIEAAIRRAATEDGVDPATALAYAERESSFNPQAHASKTIYGLYQMSGPLRQQYGMGNSADPYVQTKAFDRLLADNKAAMSARLGRGVSDTEAYYGHYFGPGRAARMMNMDPATPVDQVFTPDERAVNPNLERAGTIGKVLSSIGSDMDSRRSSYGADDNLDFSQYGDAPTESASAPSQGASAEPLDFSQFGSPA